MSFQRLSRNNTGRGLSVVRACDFHVSDGANLGDPVSHAAELILGDVYNLAPSAQNWRMSLEPAGASAHFRVAEASQMGCPGADLHLDCCATFMAPDGATVEALVLIELDPGGDLIAETYLLPMAELHSRTDYALVEIDSAAPREKLAHLACVSFSRGTRITMADGRQLAIEDIRTGDTVLTRDNGPQPVRWIGQQTVRATGSFAPIVFAQGTINNENELRLSPNQRLFFYQREDRLRAGQPEVMVKADYLVNGKTVVRSRGGFVEYFQLLLDAHEFLYAEGVAAESLTFDIHTSPALPSDIQDCLELTAGPVTGRPTPLDMPEGMVDPAIAADTLRRASMG